MAQVQDTNIMQNECCAITTEHLVTAIKDIFSFVKPHLSEIPHLKPLFSMIEENPSFDSMKMSGTYQI